jgi:hypothetical protein
MWHLCLLFQTFLFWMYVILFVVEKFLCKVLLYFYFLDIIL